jgi:hypothetical protein
MAMNLTERRAEIDRLVASAEADLDELIQCLTYTNEARAPNSLEMRTLRRVWFDLSRAEALIALGKADSK